jgi:predicted lysophospholipase L1 biosynthesis ABC-type transport system permease subunit
MVLIATILAVTVATGAMIWQRREMVGGLLAQGFPARVLWLWISIESATLLVSGCVAGALCGLYAQLLGSHFLASVTGFPVTFNIEVVSAAVSTLLLLAVALVAVSGLGLLVVKTQPTDTVSPVL